MTDILQILEEIKMILFNIKDDTDLRIKMKETVRIFAGFCDKIPGLSYPDISTDRLQDAAYRNGRVHICCKKYLGDHGSSCGLSVSTGYGNRSIVIFHKLP